MLGGVLVAVGTIIARAIRIRQAIHPHRRLDYVMVSTPRRPGAGHVSRCFLAGTEAADGVWASDHFAVVAEVTM